MRVKGRVMMTEFSIDVYDSLPEGVSVLIEDGKVTGFEIEEISIEEVIERSKDLCEKTMCVACHMYPCVPFDELSDEEIAEGYIRLILGGLS